MMMDMTRTSHWSTLALEEVKYAVFIFMLRWSLLCKIDQNDQSRTLTFGVCFYLIIVLSQYLFVIKVLCYSQHPAINGMSWLHWLRRLTQTVAMLMETVKCNYSSVSLKMDTRSKFT